MLYNEVSQHNPDDEIGPSTVTLSAAKGLSRWAARCFAKFTLSVAHVYGLPTSLPGQGQHIVARHRWVGPPPEADKRLSVGYDVLTLRGLSRVGFFYEASGETESSDM